MKKAKRNNKNIKIEIRIMWEKEGEIIQNVNIMKLLFDISQNIESGTHIL